MRNDSSNNTNHHDGYGVFHHCYDRVHFQAGRQTMNALRFNALVLVALALLAVDVLSGGGE